MRERLHKAVEEHYAARVAKNGVELSRYVEKQIVLQVLDQLVQALFQPTLPGQDGEARTAGIDVARVPPQAAEV